VPLLQEARPVSSAFMHEVISSSYWLWQACIRQLNSLVLISSVLLFPVRFIRYNKACDPLSNVHAQFGRHSELLGRDDSSVSTRLSYRQDDRGSIAGRGGFFSSSQHQDQLASYPMSAAVATSEVKQSEYEANRSPPPSTGV
jgi:hypothetical protein